jgi:16S rRNA (cytidine1402-2'-O)-methyltransferase
MDEQVMIASASLAVARHVAISGLRLARESPCRGRPIRAIHSVVVPDPLGTLYVVASAIGNPADFSPRAIETLRHVDVVLAEDTRSARKLLSSHGIDRRTQSCFDANEAERADEACALLRAGKSVALLSEAGTPAVSDPGYRVVRAAVAVGARVVPIPGPSAVLAALVASGLPTDSFFFAGFPPRKSGARKQLFARLDPLGATLVFYESPHRVGATLAELAAVLGDNRPACLARELTKTHEELVRGSLGELAKRYASERPLGEVTLVVGGVSRDESAGEDDEEDLMARARGLLGAGMSARDVADVLSTESHRSRREIYQMVLALKR